MLNVEKYREEMINILKSPYRKIAIKNGKPVSCGVITCGDCDLYISGSPQDCDVELFKNWMLRDYSEEEE